MSNRTKIINKIVETISDEVIGVDPYITTLHNRVFNKLKFWDEIDDFPSVFVNAGPEQREYLPGGFKWGHLLATIRIYVNSEYPEEDLEEIFTDIERIIDSFGKLEYDTNKFTEDMQILSINTDEGLLTPIGVGEITIKILYDLESN
jgi:hypothetical protein